jgi:hypothetical protein
MPGGERFRCGLPERNEQWKRAEKEFLLYNMDMKSSQLVNACTRFYV